jgi:hypothetical protein
MEMRRSTAGLAIALGGALLAAALPAPIATSLAATSKPPQVSTGGAAHVSDTTVALKGTVNPHGTEAGWYFQYGPTVAYGAQTPTVPAGSGATGVRVSQAVSGLQLGTTYHYRIVAVSSAGAAEGQDRTFTTKQIPLKFALAETSATQPFGSRLTVAGTLTGTAGANHQVALQSTPFPYLSGFADLGAPVSTDAAGAFSFPLASFTQTTRVRVRTLDALPTYSQVVVVHVAVLVTLRARPAQTPGLVRLEGAVRPAEPGAPVVFQRIRLGRGPVNVGTAVVRRGTASSSRFSALLSIRHTGSYRALVKVSDGRQVSGSSQTVRLHGSSTVSRGAHRR